MRRSLLLTCLCLPFALAVAGGVAARPAPYDLVVDHARIVDGTGRAAFDGEVAVRGDTIVLVVRGHRTLAAVRTIDAHGRVLTPGFIDSHAHGDPLEDSFENDVSQGVTLAVLGQDGQTPGAPDNGSGSQKGMSFLAWMNAVDAKGGLVNVAALIGFGSLRDASGADSHDAATLQEQARMRAMLAQHLGEGGFGMSSGLEYVPDRFSKTSELVDLARVVGRYNGVVESHMRSEDDDKIDRAIDELIAQGRYARAHISHIKVVLGHGPARAEQILARIRDARAHGVRLSADVYPYSAGMADFTLDYPAWARRRGDFEAAVRTRRAELAKAIHDRVMLRNGPDAVVVESGPDTGLTLTQAAAKANRPFEDYIIDLGYGGPDVAHFVQDQALQDVFVVSPLIAASSDGAPEMRHPRSWGSYAKVIEEYVVKRRAMTLETAVRKMTAYPASILGLADRGRIAPGMKADLVLFDPVKVHARSTWTDPFQPAAGFDLVAVNGKVEWENGALTGVKAGRMLRHRPKGR